MRKVLSLVLAIALCLSFSFAPVSQAADASIVGGTQIQKGEYIKFGTYKHINADGITYEDVATDILWQVVDVDEEAGAARLVSKFVIDQMALDTNAVGDEWVAAIYNSTLAAWFDGDFKDAAFSDMEESLLLYYDAPFNSTDVNKEGYTPSRLAPEGTRVSFVDFYNDCYSALASQPLGTSIAGGHDYTGMFATYKGGAEWVDYWTGTSSPWHGNVMISADSAVDFKIKDHGGDAMGDDIVYARYVGGVRPMIKIDLNKTELTGSGSETDPYAVSSTISYGTDLKSWDYIDIGSYKHINSDGQTYEDEASDILWQVVDVDVFSNTARLVSAYVLDRKAINPAAVDGPWSSIYSPLTDWLNSDFVDGAFSGDERGILRDYDSIAYTLAKDSTDDGTYTARRTDPGVLVLFPDLYMDYYNSTALKPMGIGSSDTPMKATYRDGTPAGYWTSTSRNYTGTTPPIWNTMVLDSGGFDNSAAATVTGVRPMIRIDLSRFTVTGSGALDDPYAIVSYIEPEPEPVEWEGFSPVAELNGKTLTLTFAEPVEIPVNAAFLKKSFAVRQDGDTTVTSANLVEGILILQLADYLSPSDGPATLSYSKPDNSFILKKDTIEYVPSFSNVPIVNNNTDAAPVINQPGFAVSNVQSMQEKTGVILDPSVPAWGGHQSRIVRTSKGVYLAFLVNPDIADTHKFRIYKIDEEVPVLIGEETINGTAISFVADRADNLYLICLTRENPDHIGYGRPTAFKYVGGTGEPLKIQAGSGNDMWNTGNWNYEGVGVDADGNIRFVIPYVDNSGIGKSKLVWLTLDTVKNEWSDAHESPTDWAELYIYVLPKPDGSTGVVTNLAGSFGVFGYLPPPGYGAGNYLWFHITAWNIPDMNTGNITELERYTIPYSDKNMQPMVQNASYGDSYLDSKGYTHLLVGFSSINGLDTYPTEMRYVILDESNTPILNRKLFDGNQDCRVVETPDGGLYILKMNYNTAKLEVYAVNESHTDVISEVPVFVQDITDKDGNPYPVLYSGLSVTSVRGGNSLEYFVDVAYPHGTGSSVATDWITFRLQLPKTEEATLISVDADAVVEKLNENQNSLTITVTEVYSDGSTNIIEKTLAINNNAAGTYDVGDYKVYVDTKGNTQIRACYIVE